MKLIHTAIALAALLLCAPAARALSILDTNPAPNLFTLGVRVGLNASNRTIDKKVFDIWNQNTWGTGFTAGAVCDIWLRNYISIQPGVFFETRSGKFTYINDWNVANGENSNSGNTTVQVGKMRNCNLTIPVLASVHFRLGSLLKWNVDLGPFLSFRLKTGGDRVLIPTDNFIGNNPEYQTAYQRKFNVGFKMGTGLTLMQHYYLGVHYMASMLSPWKLDGLHGRDKAWTVTLGYDF